MNELYKEMNKNSFPQNIWQQVNAIKQKMGGDPNQHIQNLLNSGRITQDEYNRAVQKVEQMRKMMGM